MTDGFDQYSQNRRNLLYHIFSKMQEGFSKFPKIFSVGHSAYICRHTAAHYVSYKNRVNKGHTAEFSEIRE